MTTSQAAAARCRNGIRRAAKFAAQGLSLGLAVTADAGPRSTIGAGEVVTQPVPTGGVAVGNPARPLPAGTRGGLACAE